MWILHIIKNPKCKHCLGNNKDHSSWGWWSGGGDGEIGDGGSGGSGGDVAEPNQEETTGVSPRGPGAPWLW